MFKRKRSSRPVAEMGPDDRARMAEYARLQRKYRLEALQRSIPNFRICTTCRELFEARTPGPGDVPQRCGCHPERSRGWSGDLPERARLCECCRLELLPSGSRWSVWFCQGCLEHVRELNARLGRYAIPIGRHSLMAGIGVPGEVLLEANPEEFSAIVETLRLSTLGWIDAMDHLHAFAYDRIAHLARRAELDHLDAIPLDMFFERLGVIEEEELGKTGAFRALARWFAEAPPPARRDGQEDTDED